MTCLVSVPQGNPVQQPAQGLALLEARMEDSVDVLMLSGLIFRVLELAGGSSSVRFLPPRVTGTLPAQCCLRRNRVSGGAVCFTNMAMLTRCW